MHEQYRRLTEQPPVDMKETYGWLKAAALSAATGGLVVAAQEQALRTRYYERKILHRNVSPTCRMCSVDLETVDHIVAGCSSLAPVDYTDRHNQVASIIHWDVCRHFGVPVESRWYRHHPDRLVETNDITMMWDTTIPTARKIKANRPDICLRNRKTNTCLLIDISCPADGNIGKKHAEKLAKYSDLRVEISHVALSNTGGSGGLGSFGHSARRYCTVAAWTLFQVITTCNTYRKQCFWDLLGSFVKSCLLSRQP